MGFRFLPYKKAKKGVQIAGVDYDDSGGGSYILPPATASTLGGVIIGDGVNVDSNGVISVSGGFTLSNTETIIGTLFGKVLYAKCWHYDNVPDSSFHIDMSGINADSVKFVYGSGKYSTTTGCLSTPKASNSAYDIKASPIYTSQGICEYISVAIGNTLITDCDIIAIYTKSTT